MKPITAEWVEKGENDFRSARRERRVRHQPNHDLACFLSQQCVEKYLKARLVEGGVRFRKTHDLEEVLDLVLPLEPDLERFRGALASLTDHAFEFRYPGESATAETAKTAFANCRIVRRALRKCLGLDKPSTGQLDLLVKERASRYRARRKRR